MIKRKAPTCHKPFFRAKNASDTDIFTNFAAETQTRKNRQYIIRYEKDSITDGGTRNDHRM